MSDSSSSSALSSATPGINRWLEDELYLNYLHDRRTVDESWTKVFEGNGAASAGNGVEAVVPNGHARPAPAAAATHVAVPGEQLVPLRGAALRIAENMTASLSLPTATSQRMVAVAVLEENRRIANEARGRAGKSKLSFTHIIGWAILEALRTNKALNHAFASVDGIAYRAVREQVNFGLAVDVATKDGARSLKVPNIKNAGALSFEEYVEAFDAIVARARDGKLTVADFEGTTISLTNPGTVGTYGSMPRLMPGQGAIIATGAIDYPAEYRPLSEAARASLGISKVMMITCTYDHRVIQGAESGMFLARLQALLEGADDFYQRLMHGMSVTAKPATWSTIPAPAVPAVTAQPGAAPAAISAELLEKQGAVMHLIHMHRVRGHLMADLDPLGLMRREEHPELDPETYGLTAGDLDQVFTVGTLQVHKGSSRTATLREILEAIRKTYCGTLTCEFMHIQHPDQKQWLQDRMEPEMNHWPLGDSVRRRILERLIEAEEFEHFLGTRFVGHKRFGLEGGESAIAILDEFVERAGAGGVHEIVIGMAHRGRLNVLANIIGKSMVQVFSEFEGGDPESIEGSGDVKYHLGASGVRKTASGRDVALSVVCNPSHLEAVDPVVEGIVRPRQDRAGDTERTRIIPLLIHGDAAFAGQGVVAETLNLSQLKGYMTGGTLHLVINNQIGFTTDPSEGRTATYPTDIARAVQAPIFHVNADDPEACVRAAQLAFDYRQQFKKDVVIDMVCYRRHGHNEADDPSYTQPLMYRKIKTHPSAAVQYARTLVASGLVDEAAVTAMRKAVSSRLNAIYDESKKGGERYHVDSLTVPEAELKPRTEAAQTAIPPELLERVVQKMTELPAGFHLHPKLKGVVDKRRQILEGAPIDWATGEAIAFGSLVLQGTPVRLSGQDSSRGTFSQRHIKFFDYENGHPYIPLQHAAPGQARFEVYDSSLSEYAVMGFEFGYSVADPSTLVLWEAQFGDFANGAQIMIDQFIATAETKWAQPSGLVLLLPHGQEGQGPEHSSARIERFLQLCGEENMQVCNCTVPAQYFHLLRRQMVGGPQGRGIRKPLILFTPKRMLRSPRATSQMADFTTGTFEEVLPDRGVTAETVKRILICSGQVYFDVLAAREDRNANDTAIIRLEQYYPFPETKMRDALALYPSTAEVRWVQEEPRNMGAWPFVREWLRPLLDPTGRTLGYAGRPESASPAPGSLKRHNAEQAELIEMAFAAELLPVSRKRPSRRRAH
jgi:2-oxoglutarate decarboxylase